MEYQECDRLREQRDRRSISLYTLDEIDQNDNGYTERERERKGEKERQRENDNTRHASFTSFWTSSELNVRAHPEKLNYILSATWILMKYFTRHKVVPYSRLCWYYVSCWSNCRKKSQCVEVKKCVVVRLFGEFSWHDRVCLLFGISPQTTHSVHSVQRYVYKLMKIKLLNCYVPAEKSHVFLIAYTKSWNYIKSDDQTSTDVSIFRFNWDWKWNLGRDLSHSRFVLLENIYQISAF